MRIVCAVLGLLYGVVIGVFFGPLILWMEGDGPVWMDRIVKAFTAGATLGAWG